jgi:hypothetical protein
VKIKYIKEEVTKDMENLRKKNQTEMQHTVEGHPSRLEQVEDRMSELKDKIEMILKVNPSKSQQISQKKP